MVPNDVSLLGFYNTLFYLVIGNLNLGFYNTLCRLLAVRLARLIS